MSPRRIDAPETAALMAEAAAVAYPLTSDEAAAFERDLAKIARRYGRAREMVKNLKRQLGRWEREMKDARREMRTLRPEAALRIGRKFSLAQDGK